MLLVSLWMTREFKSSPILPEKRKNSPKDVREPFASYLCNVGIEESEVASDGSLAHERRERKVAP